MVLWDMAVPGRVMDRIAVSRAPIMIRYDQREFTRVMIIKSRC
jgi:hypothetical protein